MKRQIDSIRSLAKTRIKISNKASKLKRRIIHIESSKAIKLAPYESTAIPIKVNPELKHSDFLFKLYFQPSAAKKNVKNLNFFLNGFHDDESYLRKYCLG